MIVQKTLVEALATLFDEHGEFSTVHGTILRNEAIAVAVEVSEGMVSVSVLPIPPHNQHLSIFALDSNARQAGPIDDLRDFGLFLVVDGITLDGAFLCNRRIGFQKKLPGGTFELKVEEHEFLIGSGKSGAVVKGNPFPVK